MRQREDGRIWLYTGDMGHMDEEGFLYFDSRIKRMLVTNGYNVYPGILEDIILTCEGVKECAVVGVPDKFRGEICKVYIVTDSEDDAVLAGVKAKLTENVSKFALPKNYEILESLPRTALGKIDYEKLIKRG